MKTKQAHKSLMVAAAVAGSMFAGQALAQAWPAKPIRMVVPFPAHSAGSADPLQRQLQFWDWTRRLACPCEH